MNDFLVGLIDRAVAPRPALQRRPRALFEPGSSGSAVGEKGDAFGGFREETATEIEPAGAVVPAPRATPSAADAGRARADGPRATEGLARLPAPTGAASLRAAAPVVPPSAWRETTSARDREPASAAAAPRPRLPAVSPFAPPAARRPGAIAPEPPAPATWTARGLRRAADGARGAEPRETNDGRRSLPAVAERVTKAARPEPQDGLLRRAAPAPVATAIVVARAAGRATARGGASSLAPGAATPAPIQVSIGRVEVRATPPAAGGSSRAHRPGGPRLSLDDYLSGRLGGGR